MGAVSQTQDPYRRLARVRVNSSNTFERLLAQAHAWRAVTAGYVVQSCENCEGGGARAVASLGTGRLFHGVSGRVVYFKPVSYDGRLEGRSPTYLYGVPSMCDTHSVNKIR
jgi:hypothetical protein